MFEGSRGFSGIKKVLDLLAGNSISPKAQEEQEFFDWNTTRRTKKVLVYFLGGVTFAEIAAIRFLNKLWSGQYKFIIATSSIISSEKCMRQMRTASINNLDLMTLM